VASSQHLDAQRDRFDRQAADYSAQHGHPLSQAYRDRFMRAGVLADVLRGAVVLDAMCGGGEETAYLSARAAAVEGLDLSPEFVRAYSERWQLPCRCASITDTGFDDDTFDVVYICGGLHHIHPEMRAAIDECWRILRPGGAFVFVEPNRDGLLDRLRRIWYRLDRRFGADEAAVSLDRDIEPHLAGRFEREVVFFGGGPAYVLIAQAFITRTPDAVRSRLAAGLFAFESFLHRTPLNPKLFVCARYRKRPVEAERGDR
jgi:SAM-dependent methyltransferase